MSITLNVDGLTVGNTYGPLLLGTFFSLVLYGLVMHQTYRYIRLHPHDYTYIQVLLALSLILETLHTVFSMHVSYHSLVTNYFNTKDPFLNVWSLDWTILTGELSQIAAYAFFVRRLYFTSGNFKYIVVLAVVFLTADLGLSLAMNIILFQSPNLIRFLTTIVKHKQPYLVHGKFASASIAHILLTGSLLYALHRGRKVRKERKSTMEWCMLYIINTGLLVSIFDLIAWILAITAPRTAWWIGFRLITVKLYMVTFLAVLNSRQLLTNGGIDIFSPTGSTVECNFISRAQRLAAAERYNAPQALSLKFNSTGGNKLPERPPAKIDIKVATEIEDGDGDAQSSASRSSVIMEEGKVVRMM